MKLTDAERHLRAKMLNGEFFTTLGLTNVTYRRNNKPLTVPPYVAQEIYISRKPSIKQLETLLQKGVLCKTFVEKLKGTDTGRGVYSVYTLNPNFKIDEIF